MLTLVEITPWHWAGFIIAVLLFIALDLFVFHRDATAISFRSALVWTLVCVVTALLFGLGLVWWRGAQEAKEFLAGYIIELSLSMDNVFVIALIFSYFRVPVAYQHRVLFFGFLDALVLRGLMIGLGVALIALFHWILYVLGAVLVVTGVRMLFAKEDGVHPEKNPVIKLAQMLFPVSSHFDGAKFFTRLGGAPRVEERSRAGQAGESVGPATSASSAGKWIAQGRLALTPLALVLLMVETTDLIFALDSIPAIFSVTDKPFIIFTSNIFAILGLRSLYFVLVGLIDYFRYLKFGLAFVLIFVGVKMVLEFWDVKIPINFSLGIVGGILLASVIASVALAARAHTGSGGGRQRGSRR